MLDTVFSFFSCVVSKVTELIHASVISVVVFPFLCKVNFSQVLCV